MSVVFDHRSAGTAESEWATARPWRAVPELAVDASRLVVLAAHPDDETLGAGGLIAVCAARGIPVHVVVVTDGEASYPGRPTGPLAAERRAESAEALRRLAPAAELTFLGIADGTIREHREAVSRAVERLVASDDGRTLVAAPWNGDGHRDHRVLGEIALSLRSGGTRVHEYPIWLWHWGSPDEVDTRGWRILQLDEQAAAAKQHAIDAHDSQLRVLPDSPGVDEPIVHAGMREHFARPFEIFIDAALAAPEGVSVDDAYFAGLYARHDDPWGFDTRWYERRKRDILVSALPEQRYRSALEVGAATGALTAALAARADEVLGIDSSADALARAAERGGDLDHVRFERHRVPGSWPQGRFDLIVLSEIA